MTPLRAIKPFGTEGTGGGIVVPPTQKDRIIDVKGNFCNLRDEEWGGTPGKGVIYDPMLAGFWKEDKDRFGRYLERHREAGTTHLTIGPFHGGKIYPGAPVENPNFLSDLPMLTDYVSELTTTPAADGEGFRLIVQMDGGSPNPRPRVDRDWPRIIEAIGSSLGSCIVSPGWELIKASDWSSADYSYGLVKLKSLGIPTIGAHLSPGRSACSSNPVEHDDPWQGGESECWKSHGGELPEVFLFQFIPPTPDTDVGRCVTEVHGGQLHCAQHGADCWMDRGWDSIFRIGAGNNGWRKMKWVAFETVAYPVWHRGAPESFGRRVASVIKEQLADRLGLSIGYGNGLPN